MLEKVFNYSCDDEYAVEKIIMDENINMIHMVFGKDQGLPVHQSNSNVYMTVIRGQLSIGLDDQEVHVYQKGDILNIPYDTTMRVNNFHDQVLELFVVKSPAPKNFSL